MPAVSASPARVAPTPPPLPTAAEIAAAAAAPPQSAIPATAPAPVATPPLAPAPVVAVAPVAAPPHEPHGVAPAAATAPGFAAGMASRATLPAVMAPALLHQALRASVESTGEAGVFRLRLLAANEMAPLSGHEALVVLLDPKASLLRAD
jgi:hypothetical protein